MHGSISFLRQFYARLIVVIRFFRLRFPSFSQRVCATALIHLNPSPHTRSLQKKTRCSSPIHIHKRVNPEKKEQNISTNLDSDRPTSVVIVIATIDNREKNLVFEVFLTKGIKMFL